MKKLIIIFELLLATGVAFGTTWREFFDELRTPNTNTLETTGYAEGVIYYRCKETVVYKETNGDLLGNIGMFYSKGAGALLLFVVKSDDVWTLGVIPFIDYVNQGAYIAVGGAMPSSKMIKNMLFIVLDVNDLSKIGSTWFVSGIKGYNFISVQNCSFERDLYKLLTRMGAYE